MNTGLSDRKKVQVVRLWIAGESYEPIAKRAGVAKGSVANVIGEVRAGRFPALTDLRDEVDALRELAVELKRLGLEPVRALAGLTAFERLQELGVEPNQVAEWVHLCRQVVAEDLPIHEVIRYGRRVGDLLERTGLPYEALAGQVAQLTSQLSELDNELQRGRAERVALQSEVQQLNEEMGSRRRERQRQEAATKQATTTIDGLREEQRRLEAELGDGQKEAQALRAQVADLRKEARRLASAVEERQAALAQLGEVGLGPDHLAALRRSLEATALRHHLAPPALVDRFFAELVSYDTFLGLEEARDRLSLEMEQRAEGMRALKEAEARVQGEIEGLRVEKAALAGELTAQLQTISALVRRATTAGRSLGVLEARVKANAWLHDLHTFLENPEGLELAQARPMVLILSRVLGRWVTVHDTGSHYSLGRELDSLAQRMVTP